MKNGEKRNRRLFNRGVINVIVTIHQLGRGLGRSLYHGVPIPQLAYQMRERDERNPYDRVKNVPQLGATCYNQQGKHCDEIAG